MISLRTVAKYLRREESGSVSRDDDAEGISRTARGGLSTIACGGKGAVLG